MCEGYERQQLNKRIELSNLLRQIPFAANMISLDQSSMSQISAAIQQTIEAEYDRIEKAHRDKLEEAESQEGKQADAFAKLFALKKQKGGK